MKRWWIYLFLVVILAVLLVSWRVGSTMLAPNQRLVGDAPDGFDTFEVESFDGAMMRGWASTRNDSRASILLVHGFRADRRELLGRAEFLRTEGYDVYLMDLRAHGESEGDQITMGRDESKDMMAVLNWIRGQRTDHRVAVVGTSLGGVSAIQAGENLNADALVGEAVYENLNLAVKARMRHYLGRPGGLLSPLLTLQIRLRLGFSSAEVSPLELIDEVPCPILLLAGENDARAPVEAANRMQARAKAAAVIPFPDLDHVDFHHHNRVLWEQEVGDFLRRTLGSE